MKILIVQSPDCMNLPSDGGTVRPFYHCRELSLRHELHYLTISNVSPEKFEKFATAPEIREIFSSVYCIPLGTAPRWRGIGNLLLRRPWFSQSFLRPISISKTREEISYIIREHSIGRVLCLGTGVSEFVPGRFWNRTVTFAADLTSMRCFRLAGVLWRERKYWNSLLMALTGDSVRRYEKKMYPLQSAVVFNSSLDASKAQAIAPGAHILVAPNGCDLEYFSPNVVSHVQPVENRICFLGHMAYGPNADAAIYFAEQVLPRIRCEIPNSHFIVVGVSPPPKLRKLHNGQSIIVTGYVEDVRPYLQSASVLVSPLRYGTGMKNKLSIGLAMGKPMVVSNVTCEGYEDIVDGQHVLVANNTDEIQCKVVAVLTDLKLAIKLATAGQSLIRERYSWQTSAAQLERILAAAGPNANPEQGDE